MPRGIGRTGICDDPRYVVGLKRIKRGFEYATIGCDSTDIQIGMIGNYFYSLIRKGRVDGLVDNPYAW